MEPPLKKQRIDNPYFEDLLTEYNYSSALNKIFPRCPSDMANIIIDNIGLQINPSCSQVSKTWNLVVNHKLYPIRLEFSRIVFLAEDWDLYYKACTTTEEKNLAFRSLPLGIDFENYALCWGQKGTSLLKLEKMQKDYYFKQSFDIKVMNRWGRLELEESGWISITRKLLPKTQNKTYIGQVDLIDQLNKKTLKKHEYPTLLKTSIILASHHLKFDNLLLDSCFTRCEEAEICFNMHKVAVCITKRGLKIEPECDKYNTGVAAMLKV